MPKVHLTDQHLKSLKPPTEGRLFVSDLYERGLHLRVTPASERYPHGVKSWTVKYSLPRQAQRSTQIGTYPDMHLKEARARAAEIRIAAKRGADLPQYERDEAAKPAPVEREPDTVRNVAEKFLTRDLEPKRTAGYVKYTRRLFDNHVLPKWGDRDIKTLTRRDVNELLEAIVDAGHPIMANRTLAAIRRLCNWHATRDDDFVSPIIKGMAPGAENKRERTLSADEISFVWPLMGALGYPFGHFFKLALVTGQRREEVAGMRWTDINETEKTWSLASDKTKAGRAHAVPLSPLALQILADAKAAASLVFSDEKGNARLSPFVFTTTGLGPISGYGRAKARLDEAVRKERAKAGVDDLEHWVIHDLRRTLGTGLGRLGVSRFIISRVLNHADRTVTGIYDLFEYLDQKRYALDAWGAHLGNLTAPPGANVVELRAGA